MLLHNNEMYVMMVGHSVIIDAIFYMLLNSNDNLWDAFQTCVFGTFCVTVKS